MAFSIVITTEARAQLNHLYDYISPHASPAIARAFTDGIVDRLATLVDFPRTGTPRDDIRVGLRTLAYRRRVTIAFIVEKEAVVVIGFFYGGQDFEALLREDHN
jgi:toxin ParE1/3/4